MKNRSVVMLALLLGLTGVRAPAEEPPKNLRQRLADKLEQDKAAELKVQNRGAATLGGKTAPKAAAKPDGHAWGYAGDGAPDRWGELSPENRLCALGTRQTPIDIRDTLKVDLERIQFDYRVSRFSVIDTGHAIQANVEPGNFLSVAGRRFELQQFHFHKPSEERINGRAFDMVAHLVHKDPEGKLAVVAVLLERGQDQGQVQQVLNSLPLEKLQLQWAPDEIDVGQLLPTDRAYYTFMGSLTTPPCSEGVLWLVLRQPVPIGAQQLAIFGKLYPMNARPTQPSGGRIIKESL
ncbi:carbonic anhydrase [Inhella gelatinilytica]|uniref:carbonic anhydrase n=1 Tax=Inhella gelatinilytica TaxID=2795030 RepID=A0A931NDL0_9BURK|nr:carbonic anhydrase family protein [Inhella gelatinilytica]MBH9552350.1 carbonic anhydrase family protein [Inhella gelatinilytica]